jgi:uracil-DNA glycosylase family 4
MAAVTRNKRIELAVRNAACTACKMHTEAEGDDVCVTAEGNSRAKVLIVSKNPLGPRSRKELHTYLERAGFNVEELAFTGAVKCLTWELQPGKKDLKECKSYLDAEIDFIKPEWILTLGNEAMQATIGKSGITKYRGVTFPHQSGAKVIPTIAPAMVYRNPGLKAGFEADLSYFHRAATGGRLPAQTEPDFIGHVLNKDMLKQVCDILSRADEVSFDIESTGFDEFDPDARIVSIAFTTVQYVGEAAEAIWSCFAVPLWHPQSPWRNVWERVLRILLKLVRKIKKRNAHNGKFDCRWLKKFGIKIPLTFDTMLAAHLLDENRPKGLKPLARTLLGAPPWDIQIKNVKGRPWWETHGLDNILRYNALDTWHSHRLFHLLREQILAQPRLAKILAKILIPASNDFVDVESHGVWADERKVTDHWAIALEKVNEIEDQLLEYVPDDHGFDKINFNPSNFAKWWLFEYLELPILARGKDKEDGSPGDPSMAEAVMLELRDVHPVINLLLERTQWYRYANAFLGPYSEQLDENSRIHSTFKLTGTVTGRLSSGKADGDKVTGVRQIRGVNLQQVPRDAFIRGVFGAPPGYAFVESDYSQIELRVAAFLAQEKRMLSLYASGQDIHMTMAMRMTGKPAHLVTKEERKKAKAVNFGFLYGMGWRKFVSTAWLNYQVRVTDEEAQAMRVSFFEEFRDLPRWHARQRALAHKHGHVVSPLGRIRHLPDITSSNSEVQHEAERQAINSPVQSFASDMALWSMSLVKRRFKEAGLRAIPIGTVHDAVNWEVPLDELGIALPMIKNTMENLPLLEVFGVDLNIPIVADLKVGSRWGGAQEITPEQVYDWKDEYFDQLVAA